MLCTFSLLFPSAPQFFHQTCLANFPQTVVHMVHHPVYHWFGNGPRRMATVWWWRRRNTKRTCGTRTPLPRRIESLRLRLWDRWRPISSASGHTMDNLHRKYPSPSSWSYLLVTLPLARRSLRCGKTGALWTERTFALSHCRRLASVIWCRRRHSFTVRISSCLRAVCIWCWAWCWLRWRSVCWRRSCCGNAVGWRCVWSWRPIEVEVNGDEQQCFSVHITNLEVVMLMHPPKPNPEQANNHGFYIKHHNHKE